MVLRGVKKVAGRLSSKRRREVQRRRAKCRLRVMTYNIHHGRGTDGRYDLERIGAVIAAQKPDIVALQEIEQFRVRTRGHNQPEELARQLGMHYAFARVIEHRAEPHHGAAYGNAILSRFPILAQEHFNISYKGAREPRGCLHATLDVEGIPIHVFCVHLGLRHSERHYQMERLLSQEVVNNQKFGNGPKILLGDFNNWWPVKSSRLVEPHFKNAFVVTGRKRLRTFGKPFDLLSLDYIFASPDLRLATCEVIRDQLSKIASDHRPLLCSLDLNVGANRPNTTEDSSSSLNST